MAVNTDRSRFSSILWFLLFNGRCSRIRHDLRSYRTKKASDLGISRADGNVDSSYSVGRYKAIIGPRLRARDWRGQRTEAAVAVAVLNRMLGAGRPNSVRTSTVAA